MAWHVLATRVLLSQDRISPSMRTGTAAARGGWGIRYRRSLMRRFVSFAVAAAVAASSVAPAVAAPRHRAPAEPQVGAAQPGYYVIRWDNTGICQIWNEQLTRKPAEWPSTYKVVSKPVPTFTEANAIQLQMRNQRSCTL